VVGVDWASFVPSIVRNAGLELVIFGVLMLFGVSWLVWDSFVLFFGEEQTTRSRVRSSNCRVRY
jgi:threonine/homoserine/homoserine lactone efflux protein